MQLKLNLNIPGTPPQEFQEKTHQVPKGAGSLFDMLEKRHLTASQAIVLLVINYFSNWDKGESKFLSIATLVKYTNMKRSRIAMILQYLYGKAPGARWRWLTAIKGKGGVHKYKQQYHQELPLKERDFVGDGSMDMKDLKFAVPYGDGSPMQLQCDGKISWQACLLWHIYRLHSNFKTAEFKAPISIMKAHQLSGLSTKTISRANRELVQTGLLEKRSKGREPLFAQLYPKIKNIVTGKRGKSKREVDGMYYNDEYVYSYNRQYRMRRDTLQLERKRKGKGKGKGWMRVSDYERTQSTYPKIIGDLEEACQKLGKSLSFTTRKIEEKIVRTETHKERSAVVNGAGWTFRSPLLS